MAYIETFSDSTGRTKQLEFRFHRESRLRYRVEGLADLEADNYSLLREKKTWRTPEPFIISEK